MIKIEVNNHHVIVDHDCKNKNEKKLAGELIKAIDIICADWGGANIYM